MVAELEWKISAIALLGAAGQADAYASFGDVCERCWMLKNTLKLLEFLSDK